MKQRHDGLVVLWVVAMLAGAGCSLSLFGDPPADGAVGDDAGDDGDVPVDTLAETDADADDADGGADGDVEDDGDAAEDTGAICGNGETEPGETCDDGNTDDTDDCPTTCQTADCGDGFVWSDHEECDDGPGNSDSIADACRTTCLRAHCGDGVVDIGEGCDDGDDTDPEDGCHACVPGTCGNGTTDPGEECDDGNDDSTDACLHTCRSAACGDGFVWQDHETCDTPDPRSCTTACGSAGTQACVACDWADCVPPAETCNGADDDCDTTADEDFDCVRGATVACATTCGTTGTGQCTDACTEPTDAACLPPAETCNGIDDDCDGTADEGFDCRQGDTVPCPTACGSTGSGTCTATCEVPPAASCTPPAETCNGVDDDCDTSADEGFDCVQGTTVSCTTTCSSTGTGICTSACAIPAPADCTPPGEACGNGVDDDCDTEVDEGSVCTPGAIVSCTTSCGSTGSGTCTAACQLPAPADCTPPAETCNGRDDDCVSGCDNGFACCQGESVPCTTTCSSTGTGACTAGCAIPTGTACTPPAEVCNGRDDDCVSGCDNGFACCRDTTGTCTSSCGTVGSRVCSSTCAWGTCTPPAEVCNGIDDDCDTLCDETHTCCAGTTRYCSHTCPSGPTAGTQTCSSDCRNWSFACVGECCDGIDNDSDGKTDEGIWCPIAVVPPVSTSTTLYDVYAVRGDSVWVVGSGGKVLQWNTSARNWTDRSDAGFTGVLRGVWAYSGAPPLTVVVGDRGVIRTWNGSGWAIPHVTPAPMLDEHLYDVVGWGPDSVVAVGGSTTLGSYHAIFVGFDGTSWGSATAGDYAMRGVWGLRDYDVWAVGLSGDIWHWTGTRWSAVASGTSAALYAVYGTSASAIRAVGSTGNQTVYDGTRWTGSAVGATGSTLYGYYARSASEGWAVGVNGTIVQREGDAWKLYAPSPTTNTLNSVHGYMDLIYAVGTSRTVLVYRAP
ncbi:MAG: hypothetical protein JXB32_23595 [Deltaproteobacteria bacterium]|nr:hypothetical protein [Deltaproteobacteria bacterium]